LSTLRFLYQADNKGGQRISAEIDAASASDAMQQIKALGSLNIELFDTEDTARDRYARRFSDAELPLAPRLALEIQSRKKYSPVDLAIAQLKATRWFFFVDAAALVFGLWSGNAAMVVVAVLFALSTAVYLAHKQIPAYLFQVVLRAEAYGDRAQLETAAHRLTGRVKRLPFVLFDLDLRIARTYARSSGADVAEATLHHWSQSLEASFYESRVATLYFVAGDYPEALERAKLALESSGGEATKRLDYALMLARVGDLNIAKQQLNEVDVSSMPKHGSAFYDWACGLIALRRGDPLEAARKLTSANQVFVDDAANAAIWTSLAVCSGGLALAIARLGRADEARSLLNPVLLIFNEWADINLRFLVDREVLRKAN
jgi:tetratricopeptide (TPR) repeat protein